jgi:cell division septation protein DedD
MSDPKGPSDQGPFSDSAELFESLFREAGVEDQQKPPKASKAKKRVKPGEELKRKPQGRPQEPPKTAGDAAPARGWGDTARKGDGIKPRPAGPLKREVFSRRPPDAGPPRAVRRKREGAGRARVLPAVLLVLLLLGGGVFAAGYLGYVDLGRPVGWLLGEEPSAPPLPAKLAPSKAAPEETPLPPTLPVARETLPEEREAEALPPEEAPEVVETASPSPLPESAEPQQEVAAQPAKHPFSIFLGSFQSLDRTRKAVSIYEEKYGVSPYWVRVDLGDKGIWHRVFTGTFSSAEEAGAFIQAKEIEGGEVRETRYAMLIGEYGSKEEAGDAIRELLRIGHSAYFVPVPEAGFRLYSGLFNTPEDARKQHAELVSSGIPNEIVER